MNTPKIIKVDPATYTDPAWDANATVGDKQGLYYWDKTVREYCTAEAMAEHKDLYANVKAAELAHDSTATINEANDEIAWVDAGEATKP